MVEDIIGAVAKIFADGSISFSGVTVICLGWICFKLYSAKEKQTQNFSELQIQAALAIQQLVQQVKVISEALTDVRKETSRIAEITQRVETRQKERLS